MKKTVASTGLVAVLSVCGVSAASMSDFLSEAGKPWNVSVSLRGFYDDNINTTSGPLKQDSFGFEVRPTIGFLWNTEQTSLRLGYAYDFTYYDKKPAGN